MGHLPLRTITIIKQFTKCLNDPRINSLESLPHKWNISNYPLKYSPPNGGMVMSLNFSSSVHHHAASPSNEPSSQVRDRSHRSLVYFNQLKGAACTWKLVETLIFSRFQPFLFILNLFQWFHAWNQQKMSENEQKQIYSLIIKHSNTE